MSTLDDAVPLPPDTENETQNIARILSDLDSAGRAWAKAQAERALGEIRRSAAGIMAGRGLDPPASDSLSPQWASESAEGLEKKLYLNFLDNIGLHLFQIGTGGMDKVGGGWGQKRIFPNATRAKSAARASGEGVEGAVSDTKQDTKVGEFAERGPGPVVEAVYSGTVKIKGVPFEVESTLIRGRAANFKLAGMAMVREPYHSLPTALRRT